MLKFTDLKLGEAIFSWRSPEGEDYIWAVSRLETHLASINPEVEMVALDYAFARWAVDNHGIEEARFNRLTKEVVMSKPVIYAAMGDGKHTLIDGSHRYVKAAVMRMDRIPAILLTWEQHEPFQVEVPEIARRSKKLLAPEYSGIDV